MPLRGFAVRLLVCAGALLAAGCGSPPAQTLGQDPAGTSSGTAAPAPASSPWRLDGTVAPPTAAALQAFLQAGVAKAVPPGTAITVSCTAGPTAAGVHCTVTIAGTPVDYLATVISGTEVIAAPAVGVARLDQMRDAVRGKFAPDYPNPTIDCGPGVVMVVALDQELTCTISSQSRHGVAHIIITSKAGDFTVTP